MEEQQEKLDKLAQRVVAENVTPELAKQATQLVFGKGNAKAEIMFIGEAPGKKEDELGEPFVGASGKVLDELLEKISLDRKDVYITNIVKYRPPNNRDPLPEEKKEFWPYLLKQISIIKPKLIATLGRHSGQVFIQDLHISVDHGNPKSISVILEGKSQSIQILPLYHPAAALYNGSLRKTLEEDFSKILTLVN